VQILWKFRVAIPFDDPSRSLRIMPPEIGTGLVRMKLVPPPGRAGTESARLAGTGSEIVASFRPVPFLPFLSQWMAEITDFEWNHHFADVQRKGPFKSFHHRHVLIAENQRGVTGTVILDVIDYDVGFGWLGQLAERLFIGPSYGERSRTAEGPGRCIEVRTHELGSTTTAVP
jgi:ligand-binding SRPBCC domain-containing protein